MTSPLPLATRIEQEPSAQSRSILPLDTASGVGDCQLSFALVIDPSTTEVDDGARRVLCRGLPQDACEQALVARGVADCANRQPKRMSDKASQRRLNERGDLGDLSDADGRESRIVTRALKQTDRLLTDRSGGNEQHKVNCICNELTRHCWRPLRHQASRLGDVSHK